MRINMNKSNGLHQQIPMPKIVLTAINTIYFVKLVLTRIQRTTHTLAFARLFRPQKGNAISVSKDG